MSTGVRALAREGRWTRRDGRRFRWWLWSLACRFRRTCPANAHSLIVWGYLRDPRIDRVCAKDCALNGGCYCGKLGGDGQEVLGA